jgi:hypothetical protein
MPSGLPSASGYPASAASSLGSLATIQRSARDTERSTTKLRGPTFHSATPETGR